MRENRYSGSPSSMPICSTGLADNRHRNATSLGAVSVSTIRMPALSRTLTCAWEIVGPASNGRPAQTRTAEENRMRNLFAVEGYPLSRCKQDKRYNRRTAFTPPEMTASNLQNSPASRLLGSPLGGVDAKLGVGMLGCAISGKREGSPRWTKPLCIAK